ncbi:lamin tail domain-containing protein, partial [Akkermansiaceae bacterium]|nr:lamin tail domain-containing protein [Akkermansiaceae bacterium]
ASGSSEARAKINEVSFNAAGTAEWVELYNPSGTSLNLGGYFLASEDDFSDKLALSGSIGSHGVLSVATSFDASGDELTLFLVDGSNNVLGARVVPYVAPRFYSAAYPDGSGEFYASSTGTQNALNNPDRETAIVINEIMADPPSNQRDGEFIELYNRSGSLVDFSGWQFSQGVDFTFSAGTTLAPGAYLVVAANEDYTASAHPGADIAGQYQGQLANGGELLRLVDSWGNLADEVHYSTGGQWPFLAGGLGSSLELKHPDMDNSKASAWADSDESNKSTFASYSLTEQYQQLRTNGGVTDYEELHIQAVGDAHLAFKNMSLTKGGGNILPGNGEVVVTNGDGATGWLCQGTHYQSTMVGNEFHLISNGHGDVKANRCEIDVTQIADNDNLTLSFDARWISGKPTVLFQTWDRSFGEVFHLPIPKNLGTAGETNSAVIGAAAPTVSGLIHSPAVPTSSDPVRVTAEVSGATTVNLRHRLDNSTGSGVWNISTMFDDGVSGGDEVAGDGVFSATLTSYQSDNSIVQFYVEATSAGGTTISPRPAPESPAMWVVDNTSHPTDLRTQRFVISAQDTSASGGTGESSTFNYAFPRLSNHYFNATFIDDDKRVIYNCEMRKSGSPWTRPAGADFARMKWKSPGDRKFRGYAKRAVDNDAGGGRAYHNRIIRYWLYLFGHEANENEFLRVIINGGSASLREDVEPNSTDFLKRNWEDGEKGELYRIDDDWYITDNWSRQNVNATWQNKGTDEPERYAGEWIKRSRENEYDYSSFVNWVESVGGNTFTRPEIERMADIDMMAANGVVRGWVDDWDTLTRDRGKNGYFLRRATDGKWMLIQWDSDNTFGNSGAAFFGNLAGVRNFYDKPYVRQRVNYYLGEMIDKYTVGSPRLAAWFDAEEAASSSYGSNESTYNTWNANRISRAQSEIGSSALAETFDVTTGNGSSVSTSADTISLNGTSPVAAFSIQVVGQPGLDWEFQSQTTWTLSDVQLFQGGNVLTVQALDANGVVIGTENFTVNKSGNALPVVVYDASPGSFNISVNDTFGIDAIGSYDPEGTSLTYAWSVLPAATLTNPTPSSAELTFSTPGLYNLTVTVTDGNSEQRVVTREIAVYPESGWSPFNDEVLSSNWTPENIEVRDGDSPSASYSLVDLPNNLLIKVERDAAHPLTMSSPSHPMIWRDLPASDDWSFHTDLVLDSIQQGDFYSGLIFELVENGTTVRYTIGMEDGDFLRVKRATGGGYSQLASINWDQGSAVIRGKRIGNQLIFEYRTKPGLWVNLLTRNLAAPATAVKGGLFAATDTLQEVRLAFDYALVVDPSVMSPTLEFLRITEVMYHPIEGSTLEFIELRNTSANPL